MSNWLNEDINIIGTYNLVHHASLMVEKKICYAIAMSDVVNTNEKSQLAFVPLYPNKDVKMFMIWKKDQYLSKASQLFLDDLRSRI